MSCSNTGRAVAKSQNMASTQNSLCMIYSIFVDPSNTTTFGILHCSAAMQSSKPEHPPSRAVRLTSKCNVLTPRTNVKLLISLQRCGVGVIRGWVGIVQRFAGCWPRRLRLSSFHTLTYPLGDAQVLNHPPRQQLTRGHRSLCKKLSMTGASHASP